MVMRSKLRVEMKVGMEMEMEMGMGGDDHPNGVRIRIGTMERGLKRSRGGEVP